MLRTGVPSAVLARIKMWSPSMTVRRERYCRRIGQNAQGQAVNALKRADFEAMRPRIGHSLRSPGCGNSLTDGRLGSPG